MEKPTKRDENAKAKDWKVPMSMPGVKAEDYTRTGSVPGANKPSK